MSARHWMIGCLIGLAGMGNAVAADLDARDINATSRAAADNCTHDPAAANGGDALGLNRDGASPHRANEADNGGADSHGGGTTGGGSERDGRITAPGATKPATLGWQSLLPGSIQ